MYVVRTTNFKFLAQFEGELCEEQSQKIRKYDRTTKTPTFLSLLRDEIGLKNRDLQKAYLGSLTNVHT